MLSLHSLCCSFPLAGPQLSPQKISGKKQCWSTSSPSFFSGPEVPFVSHSCLCSFLLCLYGPFLDTFSQRCHQQLCQTQLCPEVGPQWSWLGPAVSCTGQPLVSSPRGHPAVPPVPAGAAVKGRAAEMEVIRGAEKKKGRLCIVNW